MRDRDLDRFRDVARRAVLTGGKVVRKGRAKPASGASAKAVAGDWVTETDLASERAIVELLTGETPEVAIQAEEGEGGAEPGSDGWWIRSTARRTSSTGSWPSGSRARWWTTAWCEPEPSTPRSSATRGPRLRDRERHGKTRLGHHARARVSDRPWTEAIVGTGFPFRRKERLDRYLDVMREVFEGAEDLRRPGAASLDLAWVASGVFDGFFELGLAPWDVAAGGLLIQEAGGVVSDWTGGGDWLDGDIVAGSPRVWKELAERTAATDGPREGS